MDNKIKWDLKNKSSVLDNNQLKYRCAGHGAGRLSFQTYLDGELVYFEGDEDPEGGLEDGF